MAPVAYKSHACDSTRLTQTRSAMTVAALPAFGTPSAPAARAKIEGAIPRSWWNFALAEACGLLLLVHHLIAYEKTLLINPLPLAC